MSGKGGEMKAINRVMVCIDFSDYSKMIIEYTLSIVRGFNAEILLFHVINSKDVDALKSLAPHVLEGFSFTKYIEREKAERRHKIKLMVEEHFPSDAAQMHISIHIGIPFDSILQAIKTEKVDLVVIASKGRSNLLGTLFGSNAEKVFRHSPVPVLSVRNRDRFGRN
jgi:nucleotide-binding universal stress UspA family protein